MIGSAGGTPYAIGKVERSRNAAGRGRFHVRAIRFGKLAASYERRDGEEIRAVKNLTVADKASKPDSVVTIALKRMEQERFGHEHQRPQAICARVCASGHDFSLSMEEMRSRHRLGVGGAA
jgi:hypothetical protein